MKCQVQVEDDISGHITSDSIVAEGKLLIGRDCSFSYQSNLIRILRCSQVRRLTDVDWPDARLKEHTLSATSVI